jgi:hypothetical protein
MHSFSKVMLISITCSSLQFLPPRNMPFKAIAGAGKVAIVNPHSTLFNHDFSHGFTHSDPMFQLADRSGSEHAVQVHPRGRKGGYR